MEKIYGCKTGLVKSDMGEDKIKREIFLKYPDAVELDRSPGKYETYVHGTGYVKDTDQESADQIEALRISEIEIEKESSGLKNISVEQANNWILNRLKDAQDSVQSVDDVETAKVAMNQILLAIKEIQERIIPHILK